MMKTTLRATATTLLRKLSSPVVLLTIVAAIVAIGSFVSWVIYAQSNAERVFWSTVDNSLKTRNFTSRVIQDDGAQRSDQVVQTETTPRQITHSVSTLTYGGSSKAVVVSEGIGLPTVDFLRYTSIQTDQKSQSGSALNFSNVVNVWGKSDTSAGTGQTNGQQYNGSVLGVLPTGNLNAAERRQLIKEMKSSGAYQFEVVSVKRSGLLKRPTYQFRVQVAPRAYIEALKAYAQTVGLNQLRDMDTSQYASAAPVQIDMNIDGWSHQLTKVSYSGGARVETLSAYNSLRPLPQIPANSISADELQARLQAVQ